MIWPSRLRRRLRALLRKEEIDREMDEEMRLHIEMEAEELVRTRGLSPEDARRRARLAFGGAERFREEGRDARGVRLVDETLADLRHAARACVKRPGFAAATTLTLALGIGASTAVFSVVYGVLLKPLPFHEPGALVSVRHNEPTIGTMNHGPGTYFVYRDQQRSFEAIGAWEAGRVSITGQGEPEQVEALAVSSTTLPLLRVQPLLGRPLTAQDDAPGAPRRALLSHGYWQRRFGGAATVLGKTMQIDGAPAEIIGVLPPSFRFLNEDPAVVLPLPLDPATANDVMFDFQVLARLKPGVTLEPANADQGRMITLLPQGFE